jgi:hypothetical protein
MSTWPSPAESVSHWKNVYVVEQNNSILRGHLVMKLMAEVITDLKPM